MTRKVFMETLERMLSDVSLNDRFDALSYYKEYFDDAGITEDMIVPESVGTPEQIAMRLKNNANVGQYNDSREYNKNNDDRTSRIVVAIIIAAVTFPIWSGIILGILGTIIGIVCGLGGTIIGLGVAGISLIIVAIVSGYGFATSVLLIGIGLILFGVAVLLVIPEALFCVRFLPWLYKQIVELVHKIIGRKEISV